MEETGYRAVAIVGAGAVLPDARNVAQFWDNVKTGRYSISEVTTDRWDPELYFDPNPTAPDKTYSKIGGWVRDFDWDPMKWRLPLPPRVVEGMDGAQKWAIACTREALEDYGYPKRPLDLDRTAVVLGNAMAGEKHYLTSLRVYFPEYARELLESASFAALPEAMQRDITREWHTRVERLLPEITEDSMPGELANCLAGRIANLFNFHGPNFVTDAACASAMAAVSSAIEGLVARDFDVAITGGVDRNMGAPTFVKFCKIGALSPSGSRPFAAGADGFVMGEGAAIFVLKRLVDAERDGDNIYAVIRAFGASSDGRGKGITAPNPAGQKFAIERAWKKAGVLPSSVGLVEGHGTSTRVGDVVEVECLNEALRDARIPAGSVALGSVKSNIGHLKGAAGAAGLLKTALALRDHVLPPSVHCEQPNPDIDFAHSSLRVNTDLRPWVPPDGVRRAALSAFGFGGTNFHAVLEEYIPHRITGNGKQFVAVHEAPPRTGTDRGGSLSSDRERSPELPARPVESNAGLKPPLRGALVVGASTEAQLAARLRQIEQAARAGRPPAIAPPAASDLCSPERIAIDYVDAADLAEKIAKALKAIAANQPAVWKSLRPMGIYRGSGAAPKVAFLYTGQGSQYVNMLRNLCSTEPIVADVFAQADRVMTPLLGKPLTGYIFPRHDDEAAIARAEDDLRQTAITQPAVLAVDEALTRLLGAYGIVPDMTMGHSLGEYGALVASGALPFDDALEAVSARGREMTRVSMADNGRMAAVFAPLERIEAMLKQVDGYVVIANINSNHQAVIGGASKAVEQAVDRFQKAGHEAVLLPVSHAFHTSIVAPASEPLERMLQRLRLSAPRIPLVANVDGAFYPTGDGAVPKMIEILGRQIAAPVQFVRGLRTLYAAGARVFVECGPKKALQGFAEDVLGNDASVVSLFTNHPKNGDIAAFNQALCGLYAAGLGAGVKPNMSQHDLPVTITGAALGLPGSGRIFDDGNVAKILRGEQFIDVIPTRFRQAMLDKNITRLVKSDNGGPVFEHIQSSADVIKLAGRGGEFHLHEEFGVSADRVPKLDRFTQLAMAAGIDALRDAGVPLVMRYKITSKGTRLPDRWQLPEELRDDTGIIFASVFPGLDSFADESARYYADHYHREQLAALEDLRSREAGANGHSVLLRDLDRRIDDLRSEIKQEPYTFERDFLFHILSMGHSQFAEFIGARGPNTQINSACASTATAISVAEDWIRTGRCRRVIVVSADDITSDHLIEWMGSGFLASGAAATDEVVEDAAIPFDRRRHGMIMGMGAAALVIESVEAARERGIQPICEVVASISANSAFHGTRLDSDHICDVMEKLVAAGEARTGLTRDRLAEHMVFISHETYTPARGGSASAEVNSLRRVFGAAADRIVIANTKGFTGHAMGAGVEEVVAVKTLETGCVPPVANFKEIDPELGPLNLSKGGAYPVEFALRLGAGFGSQISMTLLRWVKTANGLHTSPHALGYQTRIVDSDAWNAWLKRMSGDQAAELEVVKRTLRLRDRAATVEPVPAAPPVEAKREVPKVQPVTPASPPQQVVDAIQDRVLAIVAEKTGYPKDMLALDLDLEADLGIDTVKQAEMFAAIREAYGIERDPNLKLRDFPTLAHVIRFARERQPQSSSAPVTDDAIRDRVLAIVAEKTGYPKDMLDVDLDLEADLGIDTVKQAEMFAAIREAYGIERDPNLKLRDFPTLAHVIHFARERQPQSTSAPATDDAIRDRVLAIVAEKTGYPKDMLALDLDLEADLGIDTVKQAEMFAAIREAYGIERDPNLKLRDFPTLAHVIRFAKERQPHSTSAPVTDDAIRDRVLTIVAEKTGYPKDMLDLDLDLEADLGIDTVKQAEMFAAIREAYGIARDPNLKLRDFPTLAHVIRFARQGAIVTPDPIPVMTIPSVTHPAVAHTVPRRVPVPVLRPPLTLCKPTGVELGPGSAVTIMGDNGGVGVALQSRLEALGVRVLPIADALQDASVKGIFWLPALDDEGDPNLLDASVWHDALQVRVKLLHSTMRSLYDQISGAGTFLVSATRLGGLHGYDDAGASAPMGGAVSGFTKAYKRERPDALVKAVDFESARNATEIAELLVEETLRDPGAIEIGYQGDTRFTVALEERSATDGKPSLVLDRNSIFVITGAAGSIVSAITSDLAAASGGTFYLLDVAPEPDASNPDLVKFASDKDGLKRDLAARLQARGERVTPVLIGKELAAIERAQAALHAIQAVQGAGGTAHYFSVNLCDGEAVTHVIDEIRRRSGRIDVLLHAAGLDRSHPLPTKEPEEFNLVFDVKADGWFHLLHAIGDMPLHATVAFSSIAGRFGNFAQTDYSAANDLLCKLASNFRTTRPVTRAIAIDWTAWGGIGMASRGSIPQVMAAAGIDMLPPEAGVPWIRHELTEGGTRGEVVVAQGLGVLLGEFDASGGVASTAATGLLIGEVRRMGLDSSLEIETTLDPAEQPFLFDHRIDGTPVLPGVISLEAFAEAALWPARGWHIESMEGVDFLAPFKFYRSQPRVVSTHTVFRPDRDCLIADCRLTGSRTLAGQSEAQVTLHSTGRVRLTKEPASIAPGEPCLTDGQVIEAADIYSVYFHGPAYQVIERAWWDGRAMVGQFAGNLPRDHQPADQPLALAPRLIELCFQTAGLCEMVTAQRMGLPMHIDRVQIGRLREGADGPLFARVTPAPGGEGYDAEVVDTAGNCYLRLSGYRTVEFRRLESVFASHDGVPHVARLAGTV